MRLLMVSHGYPPTLSGVTLVAQKLARAMASRGHQVTVVTASDRGSPYSAWDDGVRLERLRSHGNPFWREGRIALPHPAQLREIVGRFQPDIIHTHETAHLAYWMASIGRQQHIPVVATCHYLPRFSAFYFRGSRTIEALVSLISVTILNRCTHVVFATESHCSVYRQLGLRVPTTIITNGIDVGRYRNADGGDPDVAALYGLPPHPRILFVGRLAADKQVPILVRSLIHVDHNPDAHLVLVGRGDERPHLEALANRLGVRERVHFVGYVPEQHMPALYGAADVFAIAATVETQSLPTLQAMATGLPVVAARAAALPEIVRHGETGFLVPPGDAVAMAEAMRTLLIHPDTAAEMGRRGRAAAQEHAEQRTFDLYEQLYVQVTAATGKGSSR